MAVNDFHFSSEASDSLNILLIELCWVSTWKIKLSLTA
jgi:hypothetical protein